MKYREMAAVLNFVPLLLAILPCCPKSVTANPVFTSTPQDPSSVVEGKNITLGWNFTLGGTLAVLQFFNVTDPIGTGFSPGAVTVFSKYQSRFRGRGTNTEAELTILEVKRSDESTYKINVISSTGKGVDHEMKVIVHYQSSITSISKNQTVVDGDMLWLNCTGDGNPAPRITWTILSNNSNVSMPLTITRKLDEVGYRCTADNGIGDPATADVFIFVQYQPRITFISKNETVDDGDRLWLNCTVDGNPKPRITWTILSYNGVVSMPLTITGKRNEGGYRCTADNGVGNPVTADVFVFVQSYRPFNTNFSTNLTNATILKETLYLMCSAEANPAAEYRLYKDDERLANITAGSHNILLFATSVSERVKEVTYKCIPSNSFGDGPTKTITVTVHYPVEATGIGTNYSVTKGQEKTITCPVDGNPKPNIKWYKGSVGSGNPKSSENDFTVKDVVESVCYTCVASNSIGTPVSISHCLIVNTTSVPSTTKSPKEPEETEEPEGPEGPEGSASPRWAIIGGVAGGVVALAIGVGVLTWWVHKQRKCRKDSKSKHQTLLASRRSHESCQQSYLCWRTYRPVISNV